jgi:hypothetical protein
VVRLALLAALSTAASVALDYLFKSTIARDVSLSARTGFVATYYASVSACSLFAQLLGTPAMVSRIGVPATLAVPPLLLLVTSVASVFAGPTLLAVGLLKALETVLRNSVQRIATELAYLPLAPTLRTRLKPFIDGALVRTTQGVVAVILLSTATAIAPRGLILAIPVLLLAWLAVAATARRAYLTLLARATARDPLAPTAENDLLDGQAADELVRHLADDNALIALGALNALVRRRRDALIPATILLRSDTAVLTRVLTIFGASSRQDWYDAARTLLHDPRDAIRLAAARALVRHGELASVEVLPETDAHLAGYAALQAASARDALTDDARLASILRDDGTESTRARLGVLLAAADLPPDPRLPGLLHELTARAIHSAVWTAAIARAAAAQRARELIPTLIERLPERGSREDVRSALVSLGPPALDELARNLNAPTVTRAVRLLLPGSIARFGSKRASAVLLAAIEAERDGHVRYEILRSLTRLTLDGGVELPRPRVEGLALAALNEHFRLLGVSCRLTPPEGDGSRLFAARLLSGLLEDKQAQAVARAFQCLELAHPRAGIAAAFAAWRFGDGRTRANAAEFLEAVLRADDHLGLRELFRLLTDDGLCPSARAERAALLLRLTSPASSREALRALCHDADTTVAALAAAASASPPSAGST